MVELELEDARRHLVHKVSSGEILDPVATRMRQALERATGPVDWQRLLQAATWPPVDGAPLFHTASVDVRDAIATHGLRPAHLDNYAAETFARVRDLQATGVYADSHPDLIGRWSHWPAWDVWCIQTTDLPIVPDLLNPGCYRIDGPVPADRLQLHGTFSW